jgi:hypothetical protein
MAHPSTAGASMTEHHFQLIKDALIALPTIVFTGWVGYWTWLRDQERIRVQKIIPFAETIDGKMVPCADGDIGVKVVNLSLFRIRIRMVGFKVPTGMFEFRNAEMDLLVDTSSLQGNSSISRRVKIHWPVEILSHGRADFYASTDDLKNFPAISNAELVRARYKAVVVTDIGKIVYSKRSVFREIKRRAILMKRRIFGAPRQQTNY